MKTIVNLTQHSASQDQIAVGVFDLADTTALKGLLTFADLPTAQDIQERAEKIAQLAKAENVTSAMVGGAGYLMPKLEAELIKVGIKPLHAFSQRVSVETTNDDGEVVKTNVFKHVGFVDGSLS
ncbi:hypothetical protein [Acinetobacter sp. P1(2025)]|uniref:hypothetical protein n=1 Tax=Acinetobacter sp. P1(2025) TaxID=3446120 RepID=UPI003F533464